MTHCELLTIGHLCADWFLLRQLRIIGTNFGIFLLGTDEVIEILGLGCLKVVRKEGFRTFLSSSTTDGLVRKRR